MNSTLESYRQSVPAMFADLPAKHVSAKYNFVPTHKVVESFLFHGWKIREASQQKSKNEAKNTAKHLVRLYRGETAKQEFGGIRPELVIVNSHNWSSVFSVMMGMFRLVCSNGLTVSEGYCEQLKLRHDQPIREAVENIEETYSANADRILGTADLWSQDRMGFDDVREFGHQAAKLRFGEDYKVNPESFSRGHRMQDNENNLWNVFNRTQENAMKGGSKFGGGRRIRALTNIARTTEFNQDLWDLAEDFHNRLN
jgi:hypothetical protein